MSCNSLALVDSSDQTDYVLKASLDNDVRRFRLSWASTATPEEIATAIHAAVGKIFDLPMANHYLKYEDEDGDLCTLVKETVADYLSSCKGSVLKKVCVCRVPQEESSSSIVAIVQPIAESEHGEHSSGNLSPQASGETPITVQDQVAAIKIQSLLRCRKARATLMLLRADEEAYAANMHRNAAATRIQAAMRRKRVRRESELHKANTPKDDANSQKSTEASDAADSPVSPVQQFSMVTPPSSPRGEAANQLRNSSIEDEYMDDYVAWTFVAEPAE